MNGKTHKLKISNKIIITITNNKKGKAIMKSKTAEGFIKVYWSLLDDDDINYEQVLLVCYIASVYRILRDKIIVDGKEFARLSDSFIQEKFNITSNTIRKNIGILEQYGYIEVYRSKKQKNGARYVRLSDDFYNEYFAKDSKVEEDEDI